MTNQDLISIIVPVYNMARWLDRCIQSLTNQTYTTLEIILVDDGSTVYNYVNNMQNKTLVLSSSTRKMGVKVAPEIQH